MISVGDCVWWLTRRQRKKKKKKKKKWWSAACRKLYVHRCGSRIASILFGICVGTRVQSSSESGEFRRKDLCVPVLKGLVLANWQCRKTKRLCFWWRLR